MRTSYFSKLLKIPKLHSMNGCNTAVANDAIQLTVKDSPLCLGPKRPTNTINRRFDLPDVQLSEFVCPEQKNFCPPRKDSYLNILPTLTPTTSLI